MREDIQCLRGIAIILVLLFHMFPNLFVNGFLGVDMFFVISGFLMAKSLESSNLKDPKSFVVFYYKRFRRILPLYYLIVFLSVVLVHSHLGNYLWENNDRYSLASLFLVTNQLVIHDQADYFNEFRASKNSVNLFLHLWSLSVEMQFYLFVPIVFFGLQLLQKDYLKLVAVSITTIFGFVAFSLVHEKFAFNFMFLRLWQFSAGFFALLWSNNYHKKLLEKKVNNKILKKLISKTDLVAISLSVIACCLLPVKLNVMIMRPMITITTAVMLLSETQDLQVFQSKILAYIGDISYVMYLVHWPVIAVFLGSNTKSYMFCILSTFLSSILLHHLFEIRYRKLGLKALLTLFLVLILCNIYLQYSVRQTNFWKNNFPKELQDIIEKNKKLLPSSWANDSMTNDCIVEKRAEPSNPASWFGYGSCKRGNGTKSVMILGNSYVMNFRDPIRYYFNNNYSEYRFISLGGGYGVYSDNGESKKAMNVFKKQVELYKPDVLFIIVRYSSSIRAAIKDNDEYLNQMNENIAFYEKFTKQIHILGSHPLYQLNFINVFLQSAVNHPDEVEFLHLNQRESDQQMRFVKKRFSMVKCSKCHFFDLSKQFLKDDSYLTFDRNQMLSYVDNTIHLSSAGIDLCRPVLKEIVNKIMVSL